MSQAQAARPNAFCGWVKSAAQMNNVADPSSFYSLIYFAFKCEHKKNLNPSSKNSCAQMIKSKVTLRNGDLAYLSGVEEEH